MIHFPKLQTKRLTIELQELTFAQSLELAAMPTHQFEAAITKFLNFTIKSVKGVESPVLWTVQERMFAVAHYLACTLEEGNPDFSLGVGSYFDYLDKESESAAVASVEIGDLGDDVWELHQLTGEFAESIERLEGQVLTDRNHWLFGGMAAQLRIKGEKLPDFSSDEELDNWLLERIRTFIAYPDSDLESLFIAYRINSEKLKHLFAIDFDGYGIVALPMEAQGELPAARFPVSKCLSRTAREFGRIATE